jgi:hypothetical protein
LVAYAVGLECAAVAVDAVAVDLHDELPIGPVQVDLVAADEAVADRLRQSVLAQQPPEVALQP